MEPLVKVDPSVPFFFRSMDDIQVELEATVRNPDGPSGGGSTGTTRRVHYAQQQHDVGVGAGGAGNNGYDEDDQNDGADRDDDAAYERYQSNPTYSGYGGPASAEQESLVNMGLLSLQQPQGGEGADGERQSNGSTDAVAGY